MYHCKDCNHKFEFVKVVLERHGLSTPPYERLLCCPFCSGRNFFEEQNFHCRFCGSKLGGEGEFCSDRCKILGEQYFKEQIKNRQIFKNSPVAREVREIAKYNAEHGTKYSYGQYTSLKEMGKL